MVRSIHYYYSPMVGVDPLARAIYFVLTHNILVLYIFELIHII